MDDLSCSDNACYSCAKENGHVEHLLQMLLVPLDSWACGKVLKHMFGCMFCAAAVHWHEMLVHVAHFLLVIQTWLYGPSTLAKYCASNVRWGSVDWVQMQLGCFFTWAGFSLCTPICIIAKPPWEVVSASMVKWGGRWYHVIKSRLIGPTFSWRYGERSLSRWH